jgi:hypothetical protein
MSSTKRRAAHRQRDLNTALAVFLAKLPENVLQEQQAVVDVMSVHEGARLTYQFMLQVRDEVRAIVDARQEAEDAEYA